MGLEVRVRTAVALIILIAANEPVMRAVYLDADQQCKIDSTRLV